MRRWRTWRSCLEKRRYWADGDEDGNTYRNYLVPCSEAVCSEAELAVLRHDRVCIACLAYCNTTDEEDAWIAGNECECGARFYDADCVRLSCPHIEDMYLDPVFLQEVAKLSSEACECQCLCCDQRCFYRTLARHDNAFELRIDGKQWRMGRYNKQLWCDDWDDLSIRPPCSRDWPVAVKRCLLMLRPSMLSRVFI